MVRFITEGLNRGREWTSFPLYFDVSYDREDIGVIIERDISIVIDEEPIGSGARFIRRNQSHVWLSKERKPEFKVKVDNREYRCILGWGIVTHTYSQGERIEHSIDREAEVYRGTYRGKSTEEKWFESDKIYKNETIQIRFLWRENRGEPTEFELEGLLKEKQRRYNRYYEMWNRGEVARRAEYEERRYTVGTGIGSQGLGRYEARTFNIREYVKVINSEVDLRAWRPITKEKLYLMKDADIFHFEGNTETVEEVVRKMLERMINPKEEEDYGITRANGVRFTVIDRIPKEQESKEGKAIYKSTIDEIRKNIRRSIIIEPYGQLASQTI